MPLNERTKKFILSGSCYSTSLGVCIEIPSKEIAQWFSKQGALLVVDGTVNSHMGDIAGFGCGLFRLFRGIVDEVSASLWHERRRPYVWTGISQLSLQAEMIVSSYGGKAYFYGRKLPELGGRSNMAGNPVDLAAAYDYLGRQVWMPVAQHEQKPDCLQYFLTARHIKFDKFMVLGIWPSAQA